MKDIKILISSLLIVCNFFVWFLYAKEKYKCENKERIDYVNLEIKKTKINITKSNPNTIIMVNWKENQSSSINY